MSPPPLSEMTNSVSKFAKSPSTPPEKVPLVFDHSVSDIKSKDGFRFQFLRRLSHEKVYLPKELRAPKHQTLIIFDWDDTLMYSTFLVHYIKRGRPVNAMMQQMLDCIEKASREILEKAITLGQTFIVTNAQEGWVEDCVRFYMPSLIPVLEQVPIISARSAHEPQCADVRQWKRLAFLELGKRLNPDAITNLLAVGDAEYEMEAVHVLGQQFPKSLIKTVKLKEQPSPEELMKELELILPKFQLMVERASNMKIRLERRRPDGSAPGQSL